jgi:hypothetical protein
MAAGPRSQIVRRGEPGIYHVWTRTVRQAFLHGIDPTTGHDYSHRRGWIRTFQELLASLFAIEIAFRAEMSNHMHLILKAEPEVIRYWSDIDVVRRWLTIKRLIRSPDGKSIREITDRQIAFELNKQGRVEELRLKLSDISEFMKALCEYIARRANKEENRKGRFFESRFKCQQLIDEAAILTCAIYVDLNQVRAGEAPTPEASRHTSAHDRIQARQQRHRQQLKKKSGKGINVVAAQVVSSDGWMSELTLDERSEAWQPIRPSATGRRATDRGLLSLQLDEYLSLLDWSGRQIKPNKRGAIPSHLAPILERLKINAARWHQLVTEFDRLFASVVGSAEKLLDRASKAGRSWYRGQVACREAFG